MTRKSAQPYPHDVWLNVSLDGIPAAKRRGVIDQLLAIRGHSASLMGEDRGGAARYHYHEGRQDSIPRRARQIVGRAGGGAHNVTSFVLWRMDIDFRHVLDVGVFAPMTEAMRSLPGVMSTHARGEGLTLAGVYIEFRGEPTPELLGQIRRLVAPHVAT